MPDKPTCASCPYWEEIEGGDYTGYCKRNPPSDNAPVNPEWFPWIHAHEWCGEHPAFPAWLEGKERKKEDLAWKAEARAVYEKLGVPLPHFLNEAPAPPQAPWDSAPPQGAEPMNPTIVSWQCPWCKKRNAGEIKECPCGASTAPTDEDDDETARPTVAESHKLCPVCDDKIPKGSGFLVTIDHDPRLGTAFDARRLFCERCGPGVSKILQERNVTT